MRVSEGGAGSSLSVMAGLSCAGKWGMVCDGCVVMKKRRCGGKKTKNAGQRKRSESTPKECSLGKQIQKKHNSFPEKSEKCTKQKNVKKNEMKK